MIELMLKVNDQKGNKTEDLTGLEVIEILTEALNKYLENEND